MKRSDLTNELVTRGYTVSPTDATLYSGGGGDFWYVPATGPDTAYNYTLSNGAQDITQRVAIDGGVLAVLETPVNQSGTQLGSSGAPLTTLESGAFAASTDNFAIGPNSATGATTYQFRNTATFTAQTIKASAGTLYALEVTNAQAAAVFVSVYDSAAPTPGTTAPKVYAWVAANSFASVPMGSPGRAFVSAITVFSATTDNGATGSAAGVTITAAVG